MANFEESKIILAQTYPTPSEIKITRLELRPPNFVRFNLEDNVGTDYDIVIAGDSGSMIMNYINRADFSAPNTPFAERALNFLINQGYISGSTTSSAAV